MNIWMIGYLRHNQYAVDTTTPASTHDTPLPMTSKTSNTNPFPSLINQNLGFQSTVGLEELLEQTNAVCNIGSATRLTNAVHAELRVTKVQSPHAQRSSQARTDGAAAG